MGRSEIMIPESLLLKLEYEISQWQEDDSAYDIIETIVKDTVYNAYTMGYLSARLEILGDHYHGEELIREFYSLVERLNNG
jgi:hypothetical protein